MKESYNKGVATHVSLESCLDHPRGGGEALTEESTGGLLSSEITAIRVSTLWTEVEGNTDRNVKSQVHVRPGGIIEPGMCGRSIHGNREISGQIPSYKKDISEKMECRTSDIHPEKSDSNIVPKKRANKGMKISAESVEGRTLTKRNTFEESVRRTQKRESTSSGLKRVRQKAKADKVCRFTALLHHITPDLLYKSFYQLERKASPGVDGIRWSDYRETLPESIMKLHDSIHKGSYRAKPVKRSYISKEDGKQRPLGITSVVDKLAQQAVCAVLKQIYETVFLGFSYGFRESKSQHDALDALCTGIKRKKISWILDVDIQGFFDNIAHDWLLKFLEHRIADRRMSRLISKWLKTGWVEDGSIYRQEKGTPQGSVISPLLANIYLHYVFDLWANHWRKRHAKGDVIIVRYADDIVIGFQQKREAEQFLKLLFERMRKFELELHPKKTRLIEFGRFAESNRKKRGDIKPETFDFLGFTHSCSKTKTGRFTISRTTISGRFRKKCKEVKEELRKRMHYNLKDTGLWLRSVIVGFQNYFAVPGNMVSVKEFYTQTVRMWFRSIKRRSQNASSKWSWERFSRLTDWLIPRVRLVHPFPEKRFDVKYSR